MHNMHFGMWYITRSPKTGWKMIWLDWKATKNCGLVGLKKTTDWKATKWRFWKMIWSISVMIEFWKLEVIAIPTAK